MRKSNITFTEDIIEEVSKEMGLPYDDVMHVYLANVKYMRKLMDSEEVCAIVVPHLGTIHINKGLLNKSIKQQERAKKQGLNIDTEKYNRNLRKMEMIKELETARKNSTSGGTTSHTKKTILKILKWKTGKTLEEIEDIQKEINGGHK